MATKFPIGIEITAYDRASAVVSSTVNRIIGTTGKIGLRTLSVAKGIVTSTAAQVAALGAGFLSGQAFAGWVEKTGELKDFAAQIGMGVEAVQEWRYAAKQAGVDGGQFDKSIVLLSRGMGEMRRKAGPLYSFLKDVAPKALEGLADATPEQALERIIRLMEAETDATKRAAIAQAAFGRGGQDMIRMAVEGSFSLANLRKEAQALGGVMSQTQVDAVEAFGDSVDKMKTAIAGAGYAVGNQLVPVLSPMVDEITRWATANREVIAQRIGDVIKGLVEGAKALAGWWDRNAATIKGLASGALQTLKSTTQFLLEHWEKIAAVVKLIAEVWIGQKLIGGLTRAITLSKTLAGTMAAAGAGGIKGAAEGASKAAGAGGVGGAGGLVLNVASLVAGEMVVKSIEWIGKAIAAGNEAKDYSKTVASTDIANRVALGDRAAQQLMPGELENVRVQFATQQGWGSEQMKRSQDKGTYEAAQFADAVVAYLDRIGRGKGLADAREFGGFQAPQSGMAAPIEIKLSLDMENAPGVKPRARVTSGRAKVNPTYTVRGLRPLGVL